MQTETLLYIIIAGIVALLIALFQYIYKSKRSRLNGVFTFLRFITIFSVLLLLINPKFEQLSVYVQKPSLVIAVDNSSSIKHLNQDQNVKTILNSISDNKEISDKFDVDIYSFGKQLNLSDSLTFSENQTNIDKAFNELSQIYRNSTAPLILVTDGNQTFGNDYGFTSSNLNQPIYPIILGDTITYTDLKIQQLNVNKYAYLKNRFPVEVITVYNGDQNINTKFQITSGNSVVYSKQVNFSKINSSNIINLILPANHSGVHSYKATIIPIESEKNKINNSKNFAVEVIDQKTNVAIVSSFIHPDLGALKKSIESNEQRSVSFLRPNEFVNRIDDFQLVILYQPNRSFRKLIEKTLNSENKNAFIIHGSQTDWRFMNSVNKNYKQEITNQTENYLPELNSNYSTFIIEELDFESFPPLNSNFGKTTFNIPIEPLLYKRVGNISTQEPLLATFENSGRREAVLFGENLWQWRAQSYINTKSFNQFDNFIGKIVQYLASNNRKKRLNVEHESFYNGSSSVIINAQYFNKNYEFDNRESLTITLTNKDSNVVSEFPFVLKNNSYQVDLSSLSASEYEFMVKANNENISHSGNFKILEYNVEQQFLNANVTKLQQIATNNSGKSYFIANYYQLNNDLLNDERYTSIQKSNKNIIPLVDWKYLLLFIVLSLAIEWFLRKYNGLI